MSDALLEFGKSEWLTMGVELELQLIDRRTGDLTRGASDLIALVTRQPFPGDVKPEITESMLEVSTSVQHAFGPTLEQLLAIRDALVVGADRLDLEIAGGGTHPFQIAACIGRELFSVIFQHHVTEPVNTAQGGAQVV